jgi:hemoglobin
MVMQSQSETFETWAVITHVSPSAPAWTSARPTSHLAASHVQSPWDTTGRARSAISWQLPAVACNARVVRPTLFEFAGGQPAFLALATAHHVRCLQDPELNHPFSHPGQHPQHIERLAAYWAEVMGGPPRYSQACGDQSGMLHMHAGNGDMSDLGRRFVDCFVRAAGDAGLPEDAEFRAALRAYMEWAVAEVLSYPSADAVVPAGLDMPHWSWDGLQDGAPAT